MSAAWDMWFERAEIEDEERHSAWLRKMFPGTDGRTDRCADCVKANHVCLRTYRGVTLCLTHWGKRIGISAQAMSQRVKQGLTGDALFAPPARNGASIGKLYAKATGASSGPRSSSASKEGRGQQ